MTPSGPTAGGRRSPQLARSVSLTRTVRAAQRTVLDGQRKDSEGVAQIADVDQPLHVIHGHDLFGDAAVGTAVRQAVSP